MNESISNFNQNNPNRRRRFRIKIYLILMAVFLSLIGLFYLINYSPLFQVKEYQIIGSQRLSDEMVLKILEPGILRNKADNFLGFKNLLVWGEKNLDLNKTALISAQLNRDWLRQNVEIKIKERDRLAIWCNQEGICYWIDPEALAFEEAPETEGSLVLTVYENSDFNLIKGKPVVEERFSKNLNSVLEGISELGVPIKKITFNRKLLDLKVESYSGLDFLFNIRFNPAVNLSSLEFLKEKNGLKGVDYVDLRVENRIFYNNL